MYDVKLQNIPSYVYITGVSLMSNKHTEYISFT